MEWSKEYVAEALGVAGRQVVDEGYTIAPEYDEENIHRFRVAVKKLRALLRLVAAAQPEESDRLPKKFKKLYTLSGAIRDGQLMTTRARKTDPPAPEYVQWLARQTADAQSAFGEYYDSAMIAKLEKHLKKITPAPLPVTALRDFFTSRMAAIAKILSKEPLEEEDLHEIRKKVKDLQHVSKIGKEYWPQGLEAAGVAGALDQMEELAQRAGDFNDQHNALLSLEAFMAETPPSAKMQHLHRRWETQKAEDREKLLAAIRDFKAAGRPAAPEDHAKS